MRTAANQFERLTADTIKSALRHVPADDRETWVEMAMAVKSELGDAGFDIWDEWSQSDASYNARDAKIVWRSIDQSGGVGVGTLMKRAIDAGYKLDGKGERLSDAEHDARVRQREIDAEDARKRTQAGYLRAREESTRLYDLAVPERVLSHPYVVKKGISQQSLGNVRVGAYKRGQITIDDALIVPIYGDDRRIMSIQAIFPDADNPLERDRDYYPGGQKSGGYFPIGTITGSTDTVLICEGYATGAALHNATGFPVLVAFDAGNLPNVAKYARDKLPNAKIVVCADNDRHGRANTGVKKATEAATVCNGMVAIPQFDTDDGTDFDDLARLYGTNAVYHTVEAALESKTIATPDAANDNEMSRYDLASVDWFSPLPDTTSDGKKPLSTIENLEEIARRMGVIVRYNVISKEIELLIPREGFSVDNAGNASLAWLISVCSRFRMPVGQIGDFLCYIGDRNQYNPVANWIRSKPWDGKQRLDELCATITVEGEAEGDATAGELKRVMLKRWLLSAVAAAFRPDGVSAHGVLVLQGDQYLGKTKWFKTLVPAELGVIRDGLSLRPDDRDSVFQAVSHWLVELGELDATFRKADIAALKAFLTRDKDILRRAYARLESKFARRTVFFASVNPRQFLHDPTGNRRYWTLPCVEINHDHTVDMQQLWAEIYESLYLKGESWYLQPDEMALLNTHNEGFEVLDPIRERAQTKFEWDVHQATWRWLTATDVMTELGFDRPSRADVTLCGQIIRELNGRKCKRAGGKNLVLVPQLRNHI